MKKIVFLISFVGLSLNAQTNVTSKNISNVNYQVAEENVIKTLSYLTSDELEGRDSGSEGIEKAAVYLENLLKENGIKPYFKTYRDTLSNFDKPAFNIVGYIEGTDKKLKNEFVVIGAHYDHIGMLQNGVNGDVIVNGANDNATGTTAVTEVAKYFAKFKNNKRSVLFVFFSAEEKGLLGSKHLAAKLKEQKMDLYFMFNFEMIGVPMKDKGMDFYLTGFGKSNMAATMNE